MQKRNGLGKGPPVLERHLLPYRNPHCTDCKDGYATFIDPSRRDPENPKEPLRTVGVCGCCARNFRKARPDIIIDEQGNWFYPPERSGVVGLSEDTFPQERQARTAEDNGFLNKRLTNLRSRESKLLADIRRITDKEATLLEPEVAARQVLETTLERQVAYHAEIGLSQASLQGSIGEVDTEILRLQARIEELRQARVGLLSEVSKKDQERTSADHQIQQTKTLIDNVDSVVAKKRKPWAKEMNGLRRELKSIQDRLKRLCFIHQLPDAVLTEESPVAPEQQAAEQEGVP